jgi:glutathione synthase/RimK-type ligase-like ATP-grasp enzyme
MSYCLQELYNWCKENKLIRLVEKGAQQRFGKFSQLRLAADYFQVPHWVFLRTSAPLTFAAPCITKPLTADFIADYKVLFTRSVDPSTLDPEYPWLLQEEVTASHDVTVVYVAGRCFPFALNRSSFEGMDWRVNINRCALEWKPWPLANDFETRIRHFMDRAGLDFGRLDFLATSTQLYFLEVNPNGQWAWLDEDGSHGIFDRVVEELTKGWR